MSAAKPKIADYPFTTLHPNLGVVREAGLDFVLADIPGLIEGAHEGAGLGTRFLGHVERCRVLLHLVDATGEDIAGAYRTVRAELKAYGAGLEKKKEIVALSKCDALDDATIAAKVAELKAAARKKPLILSAVSGQGRQGGAHRARPRDRQGARRRARGGQPRARSPSPGGHSLTSLTSLSALRSFDAALQLFAARALFSMHKRFIVGGSSCAGSARCFCC